MTFIAKGDGNIQSTGSITINFISQCEKGKKYFTIKVKAARSNANMALEIYDSSAKLIEKWSQSFPLASSVFEKSLCLEEGSYRFRSAEKDTKIDLNIYLGNNNIYSGTIPFQGVFDETISLCM